jgi:hypothetical protein
MYSINSKVLILRLIKGSKSVTYNISKDKFTLSKTVHLRLWKSKVKPPIDLGLKK